MRKLTRENGSWLEGCSKEDVWKVALEPED